MKNISLWLVVMQISLIQLSLAEEVLRTEDGSHTLGISGGVASQDYRISGGDASVNLLRTTGSHFGGSFEYRPPVSPLSTLINGSRSNISYSGGGIEVNSIETRVLIAELIQPAFDSNSPGLRALRIGIGFNFWNRTTQQSGSITTATINSAFESGLTALGRYDFKIGQFPLEFKMDLDLPNHFLELGAKTGDYTSAYRIMGSIIGILPISTSIDFTVGLASSFHRIQYVGAGERNFKDATERSITFAIPLEIRAKF